MNDIQNAIYQGDALQALQALPDGACDTCVTSPPYFRLRDYGVPEQIGLEDTPDAYIARLVEVFREVRRVLRNDGTLWVVIGDTYAGGGRNAGNKVPEPKGYKGLEHLGDTVKVGKLDGIKTKDMLGIPWMLAFALRADGWYLRQDIIWEKPNPMPESVTDRCTKSHEYVFLFSKSPRYYFDHAAIMEPVAESTRQRMSQDVEHQKRSSRVPGKTNGNMKAVLPRYGGSKYTASPDEFYRTKSGNAYDYKPMRNKRDVWAVSTTPFKGAHFAVFPEELVRPCIRAGSREGGMVLDPFLGSGTTAVVATQEGRKYMGIEINPRYVEIARERLRSTIVQETMREANV